MYGDIRKWAEELPIGEPFDLDDVQRLFPDRSRDAIKKSVGRLCTGDDPLVARATRGIYCRRHTNASYRSNVPVVAWPRIAWRVAGPGAGLAGPVIINRVGWSTQVPMNLWIAVVGRPTRRPEIGAIYLGRSNQGRLELNVWEVSLLEAVRAFDMWAELSWETAVEKFKGKTERAPRDATPLRGDLFLDVARQERRLGPDFMPRCKALVEASRP